LRVAVMNETDALDDDDGATLRPSFALFQPRDVDATKVFTI